MKWVSSHRAAKGGKASHRASKLASSFARSCGSRGSSQRRLEKSQLPAWLDEQGVCQNCTPSAKGQCILLCVKFVMLLASRYDIVFGIFLCTASCDYRSHIKNIRAYMDIDFFLDRVHSKPHFD